MVLAHMNPAEVKTLVKLQGFPKFTKAGLRDFSLLGEKLKDPIKLAKLNHAFRLAKAKGGTVERQRSAGRNGDTELVDLPENLISILDKNVGRSRNPVTGHPEYFLGAMAAGLGALAPTILKGAGMALLPSMIRGAGHLVERGAQSLGNRFFGNSTKKEAPKAPPQQGMQQPNSGMQSQYMAGMYNPYMMQPSYGGMGGGNPYMNPYSPMQQSYGGMGYGSPYMSPFGGGNSYMGGMYNPYAGYGQSMRPSPQMYNPMMNRPQGNVNNTYQSMEVPKEKEDTIRIPGKLINRKLHTYGRKRR